VLNRLRWFHLGDRLNTLFHYRGDRFWLYGYRFWLYGRRLRFHRYRLWLHRLRFFAFLDLLSNLNHLFSEGVSLFFAVGRRFCFYVSDGLNRGFWLRLFNNRGLLFGDLLFFVLLLSFLLFLTKAQPGKEATFFLFCHLRLHPSRLITGAIYMEAKKMMK